MSQQSNREWRNSGKPTPVLGIVVSFAGSLPAVVLPLLVTTASRVFHLSAASAGRVGATEMLGFASGCVLVSLLLSRTTVARLMVAAMLLIVGGNLLTIAAGAKLLLPLRLLCGVGEGVGSASYAAIIAGTKAPERYFGTLLCLLYSMGTILLRFDATFTAAAGPFAVYWILAAVGVLGIPAGWFVRRSAEAVQVSGEASTGTLSRTALLVVVVGLIAIMGSYAACGTIWAYAANIGQWSGLSVQQANVVLSYATLAGMAGAGFAILLGPRLGNATPLLAAGILMGAAVVLVIVRLTQTTFAPAVLLWMCGINFATPYEVAVMSEADRAGRAASLSNAAQTLGMCVGPALGAMVVNGRHAATLGSLAVALLIPSFLLLFGVAKWVRKMDRVVLAGQTP
jgi:MFS transporter, DHA1 family, inner membrane transport protein